MTRAQQAVRALRSLLRQATGEAKWDRYVEHCHATGTRPLPRREFERRRAEQREEGLHARCC